MIERWRLALGHPPELWVALLLAAAAGFALADAILGLRAPRVPLPLRTRLAILGLRLLGIAALTVIVLEVTLLEEQVTPTGPRVVVLVDRSASMAIADGEAEGAPTTSRLARARAAWEASAAAREAWAARGIEVEVRAFARGTETLGGAAAASLDVAADGDASDLRGALEDLSRARARGQERPLAGVVVISDGLVVADAAGEAPLGASAASLGVPITTVAAGAPHLRDVALRSVSAGEFAFVENVAEIGAEIVSHGYAGRPAIATLERDGEVIASTPIVLPADGAPLPLRFEVAPDRVGHFVYTVAIQPQEGEATGENNRRSFVVKVLRDKVRVLHVAGRPDWDVRSLRTLLGRDPNVELLSYYILRGLDDSDREDPDAPLSLIAFPTDDLFDEQLGSFDLVILHNFDALSHQVGRYLGGMARFVEEGGAMVVIGGDLGLATGDYSDGALARVLPVDLRGRAGLETAPFRPQLSETGRRHPITAWLADPRAAAGALPELDSFNRQRLADHAAAMQAAVLLTHPSGAPLLSVAEPGKGRVLVLATGATWRLGFADDLPLAGGARPYDLLWLGAIRWLLRDAAAERLSLEVERPTLPPGERVEIRAAALSASYAPEPDVVLDWQVRPIRPAAADGDAAAPAADPGEADAAAIARGAWTTDGLGRAHQSLEPPPPGAYEVVARRRGDPGEGEAATASPAARRVILVEPGHRELADLDADPGTRRLAGLAEASRGLALRASAGDRLPADLPLADQAAHGQPSLRVDARREIPLWDGWAALGLLLLGLGGEWLLRRRQGLS